MKLSIITINYNNQIGLIKTVNSVKNQSLRDFEFIVIDGGSTDGSVKFIKENQEHVNYWVSEKDNGIYHAMNKGIEVAKGDYCLFLNSGDEFFDKDVVSKIYKNIYTEDILVFDSILFENCETKTNHPEKMTLSYLWNDTICHQSALIKTDLLLKFKYDESLKIVSDWKLFILLFVKYNCTFRKINQIITVHYLDGISADPKNFQLIKEERDFVLSNEFNQLYDDMVELCSLKSTFNLLRLSRKIKFLQWIRFIQKF